MKPEPFYPAWMAWPMVAKLVALFQASGVDIAFTGGAVRDAILGHTPKDIDIVTSLSLDACFHLLKKHGYTPYVLSREYEILTITGDGIKIDIMAIEKRVESFVPKPVTFDEQVACCVSAYDFTLNAVYYLPSGQLFSHHGGVEDAKAGVIRCVGDPYQTIQANPTRIVRFFRFYAAFGRGQPHAESLAACAACADSLSEIKGGRIYREMLKLLALPSCYGAIQLMQSTGILPYVLGCAIADCDLVEHLEMIEDMMGLPPKPQLRLLLLLVKASVDPSFAFEQLAGRWEIKEDDYRYLCHLLKPMDLVNSYSPRPVREQLIDRLGKPAYRDVLLLSWAMEPDVRAARSEYETHVMSAV